MTRSLAILLAAAAAMLIPATRAHAACTLVYQCNPQTRRCIQIPVCRSILGVKAPPPHFSPLPPTTTPSTGARQCRQTYLCDAAGQCSWRMVCL